MVIGLDFGNYNSVPYVIQGMDDTTKLGGEPHRLVPPEYPYGIPSVYFYTNQHGKDETYVGYEAVSMRATPVENRLRYLKRQLNGVKTLDGKDIEINDAITEVIQFCVREANTQLLNNFGETTNQIALSYPVSYGVDDRRQLVELAKRATLEDGRQVEVIGTIAEPAAAALDYLAVQNKTDKDTTVLVYDLGGGTFDLSLVSAYPNGKGFGKDKFYYEIITNDGLERVGGVEFDNALFELLKQKISELLKGDSLTAKEEEKLKAECEQVKIELSHFESTSPMVTHYGETLDISVTREEFEAAAEHLLLKTIDRTKAMLNHPQYNKPEYIVLTGGASQMPMVEAALKKYFPEYAGKIRKHKPTMAIACGAARFGAEEKDLINGKDGPTVVQVLDFDIGIRLLDSEGKYFIDTYLKKNAKLTRKSINSSWRTSTTRYEGQQASRLTVYQSIVGNTDNIDNYNLDNYREIMEVIVDHGKPVPQGTKTQARIVADKNGSITVEAFSKKNPAVHVTAVYNTKPKSEQ